MPFQPFEIDESIEREGGSRPYLVEGDYLFSVVGISPSKEDHEGVAAFWAWKLRIEKGKSGVGRTTSHIGTWKSDGQWGNGAILRLVAPSLIAQLKGKKFSSYADFVKTAAAVAKALNGRKLGGLVADGQAHNGRPQSDILEFYPADDYDQRAGAAAQQAPRPNGPAPQTLPSSSMSDIADSIFGANLDQV